MKKNQVFKTTILIGISLLLSCNQLENTISIESVEKNVENILSENPSLEFEKYVLLNDLVSLKKGRNDYVGDDKNFDKIIILPESFEQVVEEFFQYCKINKVSYEDLLKGYDAQKVISEKYKIELQEIDDKIYEECLELQKNLDNYEQQLNDIVTIEVTNLHTLEDKGKDLVQIDIMLTNKTNKPIYALKFGLEFYDKFGKKIITAPVNFGGQIYKSGTWHFPFYKEEFGEIYNVLRRKLLNSFDIKINIWKINHGGEFMPEGEWKFINLKFKAAEYINTGYCPYVISEHLSVRKENIKTAMIREIAEEYPAYNKFLELKGNLFRSKMK